MNIVLNVARQVIRDKFESQVKTAEAKLATLKAEAETAKADIEIKAITELLAKQHEILQKLRELKKSGGTGGNMRKSISKHGSQTSRRR